MAIEVLAQEALGISGEGIFSEIAEWAKEIAALTTEAASASGVHGNTFNTMPNEDGH